MQHCSLKCLFEGEGYCWFLTYIYQSKIVIKLTSIKPRIPQNRLMGYIFTLIHPDKDLWANVRWIMQHYSLKCLFTGGGVLLVFDIYICQNWFHTSIIVWKCLKIYIKSYFITAWHDPQWWNRGYLTLMFNFDFKHHQIFVGNGFSIRNISLSEHTMGPFGKQNTSYPLRAPGLKLCGWYELAFILPVNYECLIH